jgi:methylmalonyl-CoA epimerase
MISGVHVVSVAVRDLKQALGFYCDSLGLALRAEHEVPERGLRLARLAAGATDVVLLQPTRGDGDIGRFLQQHGEGPYHVGFEVEDIELGMRTLLARGAQLLDRDPRAGPDGRIAFARPSWSRGILVELWERSQDTSSEEGAGL